MDFKTYLRFLIRENNIDWVILSINLILNISLTIRIGLRIIVLTKQVEITNNKNCLNKSI